MGISTFVERLENCGMDGTKEGPEFLGLKLGEIRSFGAPRVGQEGVRGQTWTPLAVISSLSPSETQTCLRGRQHQVDTVTALPGLRQSGREPVGDCQGWGGLGFASS